MNWQFWKKKQPAPLELPRSETWGAATPEALQAHNADVICQVHPMCDGNEQLIPVFLGTHHRMYFGFVTDQPSGEKTSGIAPAQSITPEIFVGDLTMVAAYAVGLVRHRTTDEQFKAVMVTVKRWEAEEFSDARRK